MQAAGAGRTRAESRENQLPMTEHEASRTLVKSTPELWAECSHPASLARHLGAFGEIRITKLEPETAVAWEGEQVRGTVTLEPSGWGTRVILTAGPQPGDEPTPPRPSAHSPSASEPAEGGQPSPKAAEIAQPPAEAAGVAEPPLVDPDEAVPEERRGILRRLFGSWRRATPAVARDAASNSVPGALPLDEEPPGEPEAAMAPQQFITSHANTRAQRVPKPTEPAAAALLEALDSLGRAHHRPYSRG